jgi:hypothetical protein
MFKACITYESFEGIHKVQVETSEGKNLPG